MKEDGEPAFPGPFGGEPIGMTMRDWFAGMALGGMIGLPFNQSLHVTFDSPKAVCEVHAKDAYTMADAMIAERIKDA